jgi:hypothetical protein
VTEIPFYGMQTRRDEGLYCLSIRAGLPPEAALVAAGWQLRHHLRRDYALWWAPTAPRRTKTRFGTPAIIIMGAAP